MSRSSRSRVLAALLAAGTLGAFGGAHAATSVHISVGLPGPAVHAVPVHPHAVHPVHAPSQPVYVPAPVHVQGHRHDGHGWDSACRAPRWNPHVRYMPGQVVRRHGELFVARGISARVWNENSPPEWTPRYWAAAQCR